MNIIRISPTLKKFKIAMTNELTVKQYLLLLRRKGKKGGNCKCTLSTCYRIYVKNLLDSYSITTLNHSMATVIGNQPGNQSMNTERYK